MKEGVVSWEYESSSLEEFERRLMGVVLQPMCWFWVGVYWLLGLVH
jgi:hypothetical protein